MIILEETRKRFVLYIIQQIKEVQKGGWPVFFRKCYTVFLKFMALFVVLIVRMLRPFILIRFAPLNSDRIGSFGRNELYLLERNYFGLHKKRTLDFFYYTYPICNQQFYKMLRPYLHILGFTNLVNQIYQVNCYLPGGKENEIPLPLCDTKGLRRSTPPFLAFTPQEEQFGLEERCRIGIPERAAFTCFYARDSVYLNTIHPGNDFSYHNYRNSSIHNFIFAAEELAQRGYYVLRMGAIVKESLNTTNPKIIDYASKYRNDFLDIYLLSKCSFFLGDPSGIAEVPQIFRRPVAWVDFTPIAYMFTEGPHDLIITKKLWLRKENRFLTFQEIANSKIVSFCHTHEYEKSGIDVIENTAEEIADLAIEMDERLKGTWDTTKEDDELQQRFWDFFKKSLRSRGEIKARIGREFLRKNRELLE